MSRFNIDGSTYNGLGDITTKTNKYLILYDGKNVNFLRETKDGNYFQNNNGRFNNIAFNYPNNLTLMTEDIILKDLTNRLTNKLQNMSYEEAVNYITTYIAYLDVEIKNIDDNYVINTTEEGLFRNKCMEILNSIEERVEAKLKVNDKDTVKSEEVNTASILVPVFNSNLTITKPSLDIKEIIQNLTMEDLNNINYELVKDSSREPLSVVIDLLSEREDIKYLINNGYSKEDAIRYVIIDGNTVNMPPNGTMEQAKVKVLSTNEGKPSHSSEGSEGFIEALVYVLIGQIVIFALIIGVLMIMMKG